MKRTRWILFLAAIILGTGLLLGVILPMNAVKAQDAPDYTLYYNELRELHILRYVDYWGHLTITVRLADQTETVITSTGICLPLPGVGCTYKVGTDQEWVAITPTIPGTMQSYSQWGDWDGDGVWNKYVTLHGYIVSGTQTTEVDPYTEIFPYWQTTTFDYGKANLVYHWCHEHKYEDLDFVRDEGGSSVVVGPGLNEQTITDLAQIVEPTTTAYVYWEGKGLFTQYKPWYLRGHLYDWNPTTSTLHVVNLPLVVKD